MGGDWIGNVRDMIVVLLNVDCVSLGFDMLVDLYLYVLYLWGIWLW